MGTKNKIALVVLLFLVFLGGGAITGLLVTLKMYPPSESSSSGNNKWKAPMPKAERPADFGVRTPPPVKAPESTSPSSPSPTASTPQTEPAQATPTGERENMAPRRGRRGEMSPAMPDGPRQPDDEFRPGGSSQRGEGFRPDGRPRMQRSEEFRKARMGIFKDGKEPDWSKFKGEEPERLKRVWENYNRRQQGVGTGGGGKRGGNVR